jgi:hypothetical protein
MTDNGRDPVLIRLERIERRLDAMERRDMELDEALARLAPDDDADEEEP